MTDQSDNVVDPLDPDPEGTHGWILVGLANGIFQRYDFEGTKLKVIIAQLDADEPYDPPEPRDYLFKARVATQAINVRANPSMQSSKVGVIVRTQIIRIKDIYGWWWQHNQGGWSHSWWLRRIPKEGETVYKS